MAFVAKKASTGEVDEGKMRLNHHFFCLHYNRHQYKDMAIVCGVGRSACRPLDLFVKCKLSLLSPRLLALTPSAGVEY